MFSLKYLFTTISIAAFVGVYQIPQVNIYLTNKNINIEEAQKTVNSIKEVQQFIENKKFSILAQLTNISNIPTASPNTSNPSEVIKKDSGSTEIAAPVEKKPKCTEEHKCTVLLMGDSVMGDISRALQRAVKKEKLPWMVVDAHKVSSGLSVPTYYDWIETSQTLMNTYKPTIAFMLLGTNDAQGIRADKKDLKFASDAWLENYTEKLKSLSAALDTPEGGKNWYFIQSFKMRDSGFNKRMQVIRELQEITIEQKHFISVDSLLEDDKGALDLSLRVSDGIHLSAKGADKIVSDEIKLKLSVYAQ